MLYLIIYGDESNPDVDVILCDRHPERTDEGTWAFKNEGQPDFCVYPGDFLWIQYAHFMGNAAKPAFFFDVREGSPFNEGVSMMYPGDVR